ncbi:MAG: flavodoxin family protein [Gammaproteobacteria bacterium]
MKIGIVYHSGWGHTEVLAKHIAIGIESSGQTAYLMQWDKVDNDLLNECAAIIFGCPTYMGSASAEFKTFMDKTSAIWKTQAWKNKFAAGFTNSAALSGDKLSTLLQLTLFAMQHSMIWVGMDLVAGVVSAKSTGEELNRLGGWLGLIAQSNIDESAETAPPQSDRRSAEYFGSRIVDVIKLKR